MWKRLKNLWRLSEYTIGDSPLVPNAKILKKNVVTIERKLATIIPEEKEDLFPNGETT